MLLILTLKEDLLGLTHLILRILCQFLQEAGIVVGLKQVLLLFRVLRRVTFVGMLLSQLYYVLELFQILLH